jgi:PAS domain S-box-containing protein
MKKIINETHKNKNVSRNPADLSRRTEKALRRSEKYFKEIIEKFSDIVIVVDKAGHIKSCSLSVERFTGYKPDEVIGKSIIRFIHKDDIKRAAHDFSKAIRADEHTIIPNAFRIVHKNGSEIYLDGLGRNLLNNPDIAGFVMNVRDITESKKMEEKYRNILENIQEGYFEVDLAGNFTFFNDSMCRIHGYPKKELMGMNNRQYLEEYVGQKVYQAFNQVYKTGKPLKEVDWQIIRKDGTKVYIEASISLRKDSSGKPVGFRGIIRDITERRSAAEKLLFEGQRFRALADHSSDIILFLDPQGTVTYINPAVERILGHKVEERIGASALEPMHPDDIKPALDKLEILATDTNSPVLQMEMRLKDKGGSWHTFETVGSNLVKDNTVEAIIIRQHDITERKLAEEKLRESEANYRQLFDNSPAAIYQVDYKTGKFLKANDLFCEYIGCSQEEITSLNPFDILTEESKKLFLERLEKISQGMKVPETVEFEAFDRKGKRWILQMHIKNIYDTEGHVVAADVVAHDITERKKTEEELKRFAENLEDTNIALRVLMNKRGEDQREFEEKLQVNINDLVIPYLKKLSNANLDDRSKKYVGVLESNLSDVLSPFMRDFRSSHKNLTPQEIQIVDLILKGKNTKEIADMLNASANTIATHRNNIRKKMNLRNSKINLRSHILSLKK